MLDKLWYWITERHSIFLKRLSGEPWPWTDDSILRDYKFTNVFRQLDRGTIILNRLLKTTDDMPLKMFTIVWYRLFNRAEHAEAFKVAPTFSAISQYLVGHKLTGGTVFTSAHMVHGSPGKDKLQEHLEACMGAWEHRKLLWDFYAETKSIRNVFDWLVTWPCIGRFLAYEIVCDMEFVRPSSDYDTWANVGPGAARGLRMLGLSPTLTAMKYLLEIAPNHLPDWVTRSPHAKFSLREIEHSLCEFSKYWRAKTGLGRPRVRYVPLRSN